MTPGALLGRDVYGLVLAAVVFAFCAALLPYWFGSSTVSDNAQGYQQTAVEISRGKLPYRDFALEYPPASIPLFLAPSAVAGTRDSHAYARSFARLMGAVGVVTVLLAGALGRSPRTLAFLAISPLLVGPLIVRRFDLWPALLTLGAIALLVRDRHRFGWALLGASFAAKLYPIVLLPLAASWTLRRAGRRTLAEALAACGVVVAVAFGPFALLATHGLWESVWGEFSRPMQVESLPASALTTFSQPTIITSHHSWNIAGHTTLTNLTVVAEAAVLVCLWVGFARGEMSRDRLVRYAAASICAAIALAKVLSPQYLIWLIPLVALVKGPRGRAATAALAAALVATQVWQPSLRYLRYLQPRHELAWLVLTRNILLLLLLALLALPAQLAGSLRLPASLPWRPFHKPPERADPPDQVLLIE